MKWFAEIKKVGIRDWLWFVIWLGRNEFSPNLEADRYTDRDKLRRDRDRAHKIDEMLE